MSSNFTNVTPHQGSNLFLIGSADNVVNDKFSETDTILSGRRRRAFVGERLANKFDKKDFLVCPQIEAKLDSLCGNIDFYPESEKYAAAFVY